MGTDTEDSDDALPVTSVNDVLGLVGVSPIGGKRNIRSRTYVKEKITRAEGAIRKAILFAVGDEAMEQQDDDDDGREMIEQLKEKFTSTTSRSERLTILTDVDVVVDIVVTAVAKVLIVVVWPLSITSVIVTLEMAALLKNVCGSQ